MANLKITFAVARVVFNLVTMAHGYQTTDALIPNPPRLEYRTISVKETFRHA